MAKNENDVLEDSLMREVKEDLQNEKIEKIWNKYGVYIVALVVLIVSTAVGYESISAWYRQKLEKNSDKFVAALNLESNEKNDIVGALDKVADETTGIYPVLANLEKANILLSKKEYKQAIEILNDIYRDSSVEKEIRYISAIKIASYEIDFGNKDNARTLLNEIIAQNNTWSAVAKELLASLEVKLGNLEAAKVIYRNLMADSLAPASIRKRAEEILSVL